MDVKIARVHSVATMKPIAWVVVGVLTLGALAGACRSSDGGASQPPPGAARGPVASASAVEGPAASPSSAQGSAANRNYAGDIEKLCNVITLSGADKVPKNERALPIANWLAANLTTPESRQFLVRIQPLVGNDKASALDAEARRVGHDGCPLAAEWR